MLYTYSITPLSENEFEARADDIIRQVKRKAFLMPLFSMTLTPEGVPVWDKVGKMTKLYARYRDRLQASGVSCGILVQASLGHEYPITKNPFQPYVNLTDGKEVFAVCPEDEAFLEHFAGVMRALAKEKPKAIMLDDDFRLMMRGGRGCACPRHMEIFNRLAGTDMTREELYGHIRTHSKTDRLARIFTETQRNSLIKAAKVFRAAIDEVDPTIQGINCTSGHFCEAVSYTNKIFAGKSNPTMVRIPNGIYAPYSVRGFSDLMRQTAICSSKLKKNGIDIILSETDTIPFNRYAKSARYLHAHFTASVLDGLKGAKHWLTRMSAYEPHSATAYRDILAEHNGMYEALANLSDCIKWVGACSAFTEQVDYDFNTAECVRNHTNYWAEKLFERIGIPFFFSDGVQNAVFIEGDLTDDLTDEQIKKLFDGSVFLDGFSAKALYERGFGELLGVSVGEWDFGAVNGESFDGTLYQCCTAQKNFKKLTVTDPKTEILSNNYRRQDGYARLLTPAVTVLEREGGKLTAVFCGSPNAEFDYSEGFAFLNESRKKQLVSLLRRAKALPVYVDGDGEILLRAGYLKDETLLLAMFELGIDPIDRPTVFLEAVPHSISIMLASGKTSPIEFKPVGNGLYSLGIRLETLYPVILFIK